MCYSFKKLVKSSCFVLVCTDFDFWRLLSFVKTQLSRQLEIHQISKKSPKEAKKGFDEILDNIFVFFQRTATLALAKFVHKLSIVQLFRLKHLAIMLRRFFQIRNFFSEILNNTSIINEVYLLFFFPKKLEKYQYIHFADITLNLKENMALAHFDTYFEAFENVLLLLSHREL